MKKKNLQPLKRLERKTTNASSSREESRTSNTSPDSMEMKEISNDSKALLPKAELIHSISNSTESDLSSLSSCDEEQEQRLNKPQSYREKLKERFENIKKKSLQSIEKKGIREFKKQTENVISINKCIANLKQENEEIEQQLQQRKTHPFVGDTNDISSTLKYQFFCESIRNSDDAELAHDKKDNGIYGQSKNNTKDITIVNVGGQWMLETLRNTYEEFTWRPGSDSFKFDVEDSTRNLSDEGLFVDVPRNIPVKQQFLLKQRLLASGDTMWFDSSNEIAFDESNCSRKSYRPDGYETENTFDTVYVKASLSIPETLSSVTIPKENPILELNIFNIRFTSHPLFSDEHFAQEELLARIDEHKALIVHNKRDKLFERLQTLRKMRHGLRNDQSSGDHSKCNAILKQIKSVREDFYHECKRYRNNAKMVLEAWKAVKEMREKLSYSTTSIRLVINKSSANIDDYDEALAEIYAEKEDEYKTNMLKYRNELSEWKKYMEKRNSDEIRTEDEQMEKEKPAKPPRIASKGEIQRKLKKEFEHSFGSKEEPWLSFTVTYTNEMTKTSALEGEKNEEKMRRASLQNSKMFLKLLCNDAAINKSGTVILNDRFTLEFNNCLNIQLAEPLPAEMQLYLYQQSHLIKHHVHTFLLNIPPRSQCINRASLVELHFEKTDNAKEAKMSGFLTFSIGWRDYQTKPPVELKQENCNLMNSDGTLNAANIADWIAENKPDPQDPRNAIIFDYDIGSQENSIEQGSHKYFRCDPYLEILTIGSKHEIENNIRFQVLQLRDKKEPEFVGLMVPIRLQEIPSNIFSTYNRRINEERYQEYLEEEEDGLNDDITKKRSMGRRYLQQIHTKVYQMCINADNNMRYEDIVNEKMLSFFQILIKMLLANFINWFKWRPARPIPMPIVENPLEETLDDLRSCRTMRNTPLVLMVKIKSGHNLPLRLKEEDKAKSGYKFSAKAMRKGLDEDTEIQSGEYFVEVSYKDESMRTSLATEAHPVWNEILQMKIDSKHIDLLRPASLEGVIKLNLFAQMKDATVCLGKVEVPISATIGEAKLVGHFPLSVPLCVFGYQRERDTGLAGLTTPRMQQANSKLLSTLEMEVQMESTFPGLYMDTNMIPSNEPPYLRDHILNFNRRFNENHPKRSFNALTITSNGKTSCLTRFIKPLEPPQMTPDGFDITAEQCAKYVSLIPFTNANKFYENIWLTSEQMLKLGSGTLTDHAVLLTCYLLSLKLDVWLLLGFGIPHGRTSYILQREYVNETMIPNHYIIDVVQGSKYNVTEPNCPLQKIYCVINEVNIWANKQRGDSVASTRFDLAKKLDWQPLFNKQIPSPGNSMQQKLHYLRNGDTKGLQSMIEKKLRRKISKLRTHDVTIWNHHMSSMLSALVHKLEKQFAHNKSQMLPISDIEDLSRNWKINGFVNFIPFVSIKQVIAEVVETKVHSTTSNVEFALAVKIQSYTNQVVAVFIAFANIKKK